MLDWLRRILLKSNRDERQQFYDTIDALNAEAGGGKPRATTRFLGSLRLRSGTLVLADPQYVPGLEVPNIAATEAAISASLWEYPRGTERVSALNLQFGERASGDSRRKIGEIGVDSAKMVVADQADIQEHWTEVGKDRIGVISTARDDTVLRMLTRRFKLRTVQVNAIRAEVVGRVSEQLEKEIEAWLKSKPEYAQFPFMHFYVQTNNSFDRVNFTEKAWDFMPVGNEDQPLMFVCGTGRGDGTYDVECEFVKDVPIALSITFIGS